MDEYISRQEALNYIENNKHRLGITEANACNFKEILKMQPTANVKEVIRGKWSFCGSDRWNDCYVCSVCGEMNTDDSNFCPNCGADMRGE